MTLINDFSMTFNDFGSNDLSMTFCVYVIFWFCAILDIQQITSYFVKYQQKNYFIYFTIIVDFNKWIVDILEK